jgi:hypothetical protein
MRHIDTPTGNVIVHAKEMLVPLLFRRLIVNEDFAAHHMNEAVFSDIFGRRQQWAE